MSFAICGRPRRGAVAFVAAGALAVGGCGSGGNDEAAKKGYYGAINSFCQDIKGAAANVQQNASAVQSGGGTSDPRAAVRQLGSALQDFADTTDKALGRIRKVKVPGDFKDFNSKVVTAFGGVVQRLQGAAQATQSGDPKALAKLGNDLNAAKLPDLPKDVAGGAPDCVGISR